MKIKNTLNDVILESHDPEEIISMLKTGGTYYIEDDTIEKKKAGRPIKYDDDEERKKALKEQKKAWAKKSYQSKKKNKDINIDGSNTGNSAFNSDTDKAEHNFVVPEKATRQDAGNAHEKRHTNGGHENTPQRDNAKSKRRNKKIIDN